MSFSSRILGRCGTKSERSWYEVGTKFDDCGTKFVESLTKYNPEVIRRGVYLLAYGLYLITSGLYFVVSEECRTALAKLVHTNNCKYND